MRVIVTRPQREAHRWVQELSALGCDAVALPLIEVGPVEDPTAVQQAWWHLHDYLGVMFVSANAVDYFFKSKPAMAPEFNVLSAISTRAWATGPGTAAALRRAGVATTRIDVPPDDAGQFDSEALWQVVGVQIRDADKVLIVRGSDGGDQAGSTQGSGRHWLAQRVAQAGAQARFVVAYQRRAPVFDSAELELAHQAAIDGSMWLLSSSEAVANLCACLPGQDWSKARALATHPRIGAAARKAGFGWVAESRPTLSDVVDSLRHARQSPV